MQEMFPCADNTMSWQRTKLHEEFLAKLGLPESKKNCHLHTKHSFKASSKLSSSLQRKLQHDIYSKQNCDQQMNERAIKVVRCLKQFGMAVIDRFLGVPLTNFVKRQTEALSRGMRDGQTLQEPTTKQRTEQVTYRSDKIAWLNGNEQDCQAIGLFLHKMDSLIKKVSNELTEYNIEGRTMAMAACYPGHGSNYVRHVDNPYKDGRVLTCIYYLNEDWCSQDGGMLRIYPGGGNKMATIEPIIDRLVIFWSDNRSPHEVLPTNRARYAITVWYFDTYEREAALKRLQQSQISSHCKAKTSEYNPLEDDDENEEINVVDIERSTSGVSFYENAAPKVDMNNVALNPICIDSDTNNQRRTVFTPRNKHISL